MHVPFAMPSLRDLGAARQRKRPLCDAIKTAIMAIAATLQTIAAILMQSPAKGLNLPGRREITPEKARIGMSLPQ
ncbi:hypothetical protein [Asticcacaulis sp. YBE204]|uniref:hypothetical protein n=1 Tax=Asticcacaulis sp. YBE204 TaxID=1282363 RepID=UPI0003C3ADBA|nr:hypothetical protein [Asticcacaulis sp. YBE204]ESQ76938.1 hypothetical protein AEYBE204_18860 [Asticcacaulis sp. YBE204]